MESTITRRASTKDEGLPSRGYSTCKGPGAGVHSVDSSGRGLVSLEHDDREGTMRQQRMAGTRDWVLVRTVTFNTMHYPL